MKLQFDVLVHRHGYEYSGQTLGLHRFAPTEAKLRTALTAGIETTMQAHHDAERNNQRRMIFCGDGTVLLVEWRYGSWGYSIAGAHRDDAGICSCSSTSATLDEEVKKATEHAAQSYGGVIRVQSI